MKRFKCFRITSIIRSQSNNTKSNTESQQNYKPGKIPRCHFRQVKTVKKVKIVYLLIQFIC